MYENYMSAEKKSKNEGNKLTMVAKYTTKLLPTKYHLYAIRIRSILNSLKKYHDMKCKSSKFNSISDDHFAGNFMAVILIIKISQFISVVETESNKKIRLNNKSYFVMCLENIKNQTAVISTYCLYVLHIM